MPRDDIARTHPILTAHWPDFPPQSAHSEPPPSVRDLRFQRNVEQLHCRGPRALHELLSEIGATRQIQTHIEARTAAFASIKPNALKAVGGDRFPVPVIREGWP